MLPEISTLATFPLCSTSSPGLLSQVTKQRLLQPSDALLSVKCSQTGRIPVWLFTVWYLLCQTHLLFFGHSGAVGPWHLCSLGCPAPLVRTPLPSIRL